MVKEMIPTPNVSQHKPMEPLEHFSTTKDTTDYLWFITRYHISRAFLQPKKNLLVVLEEMGGKLDGIEIRKGCDKDQSGHSKTNSKFGVFGNCGHFLLENAIHQIAKNIVEQYCLGKTKCVIPVDKNIFDKQRNSCPGSPKTLAIQAHCGRKNVQSHMST
ncbi:beta-galactosidase [Trifolium repens]|nr:beta-galactosidase [Trifolium repens]